MRDGWTEETFGERVDPADGAVDVEGTAIEDLRKTCSHLGGGGGWRWVAEGVGWRWVGG